MGHRLTDFELVDVSPMLPELKRTPGLTSWKATNDKQITTLYDTYEEFLAENQDSQGKMGRSHWPPADVESLNLPRWSVISFPIGEWHS